MTDPTPVPILQRSPLVRFVRWLFSWRGLRRVLIVMAWAATLIAVFYAEENWRGRSAWNKCRRELEARGEQLDFKVFIPKPVPDEQNFAATPFIQSWFERRANSQERWPDAFSRTYGKVPRANAKNAPASRQFIDLAAWQAAFESIRSGRKNSNPKFESGKLDSESRAKAAPAVLEELKMCEAMLAELRAASSRPYVRYPIDYDLDNPWGIRIPHTDEVVSIGHKAELAAGQSDHALDDVKLALYLADSLKEEVFLVSYLVRLACLQLVTQPIWEGLAEHRWSDAQLRDLQTALQHYELFKDVKRPLDGERAAGILTADLLWRQKYRLSHLLDDSSPRGSTTADVFARIAPHGWYHQEQLNYCRLYENQLAGTFDAGRKRGFPEQIESHAHELEREVSGGRLGKTPNAVLHHRLIAAMLLPSLGKIPFRTAAAQTAVDQAALACALERYRLANGQFPDKLEALVPQFVSQLPNDVVSGDPYKYRRTADGQFFLYSIGWDEKDDGGAPGKNLYDEKRGDWVWDYPAK